MRSYECVWEGSIWEHYPQVLGQEITKVDPYVQELHCPLLNETLVSKIVLKYVLWLMDLEEMGTPSINTMCGFQLSR